MKKRIYLINPRSDFPNYYSAEVVTNCGLPPVALVADLAIATVAALACDYLDVELCDQSIQEVDYNTSADFVGITGKSSQLSSMIEIAARFKAVGKVVLIGGPCASLSPEVLRPHCDILVTGELESISEELFSDLTSNSWQQHYHGAKADLASSPLPRWDLYPNQQAIEGCLQTSRGCPFTCEFCDVIEYVGRKQRHKPIEQVIAELESLWINGYTNVFIADDNFTVYRKRTRELLTAITHWNEAKGSRKLGFSTQLSIDIHRDRDILELCSRANLKTVYIGIESPNEASLLETGKRQNMGGDMASRIQHFLDCGIAVVGGMIVGFDADDPSIFAMQHEFAMSLPVPIFTVGALVAPDATQLYRRMAKEGRLTDDMQPGASMTPWQTNIVPAQITRRELFEGLQWLAVNLYSPAAFESRVMAFIDAVKSLDVAESKLQGEFRQGGVTKTMMATVRSISNLGAEERSMVSRIVSASSKNPASQKHVFMSLFMYAQIRYMYARQGLWNARLVNGPPPIVKSARVDLINLAT